MSPAETTLDRPWRIWASVIIVSVLAFSVLFGFIVIPVVQGRSAGIDPFTAICRAIGIDPGSPAARQTTSDAKTLPPANPAWTTRPPATLPPPVLAGEQFASG